MMGVYPMGRTARNTTKSDTQYRFRLSQELDERIDRAWRSGLHSELDRSDFTVLLVRMGIDEYERRERIIQAANEVEASRAADPKPRESAGGA